MQKAIAEGASTSQVTAISVLASIYLQAVIAAGMEEVEMFLAPLTARSKVREVLRGLVATRQVHTISMGHSPQFYVAGTLPEFAPPVTTYSAYTSSSMPASAYFMNSGDREEEAAEFEAPALAASAAPAAPVSPTARDSRNSPESHAPRAPAKRKPASGGKSAVARPHFSRPATHSRDRKPAQSSSSSRAGSRPGRRTGAETRLPTARPARPSTTKQTGSRTADGLRRAAGVSWSPNTSKSGDAKQNGVHAGDGSSDGDRSNGIHSNGSATKPSAAAWSNRNGHGNGAKATAKPGAGARNGSAMRKETRPDARPARNSRKPALTAGARAGNNKQYGFTARPKAKPEQETKKRA